MRGSFAAEISDVTAINSPPGLRVGYVAGVCEELAEASARQDGREVVLSVRLRRVDGTCRDLAQVAYTVLALESPLGDRTVRDADSGRILMKPEG